jgi:hypothetical protein
MTAGLGKKLSAPEPEYFTAESAEFTEFGVFLEQNRSFTPRPPCLCGKFASGGIP